jgi:hypothetical protein
VDWHEYLQNPEAVSQLYGASPDLDLIELTNIELERDGPTVTLSIVLPIFPKNPPVKWSRSGFNSVTMRLRLFAVTSYCQDGWNTDNVAHFNVARIERTLFVNISGNSLKLSIACGFMDVAGVVGFSRTNTAYDGR